jgi:beta-lactam-binding protein with PASTA domain
MPDIVGKRLDQVAARVRAEGFALNKVSYRRSPGVDPGLVIQQQPQAGHRILKSDSIILEVSQ